MTSVNRTPHLLALPESSRPISNRAEPSKIATGTYSLLGETFSEAASVFTCSYEQHPTPSLCDAIGICYLGSSSSTKDEAHGHGLYLSSLFFGSEVIGVHHNDSGIPSVGSVLVSPTVKALLDIWRIYLEEHPGRNLLQCFYGDGCHAVAKALQMTPYAQRITVVGIQSPAPIPHHSSYLFQTKPHSFFRKTHNPQATTLALSPQSLSLFTQSIQDPVFAPCLLRAFYETLKTSRDVLPDCQESKKQHHRYSLAIALDNENETADWIDAAAARTLANPDLWTESRLAHALNLALAAYRVADYIYLIILPLPKQTATNTPHTVRSRRHLLSIEDSASTTEILSTTHSEVTTASLLPTVSPSPTATHEYPQHIYPCGILPNGTFPNGIDPFNGTFSNNTFPYPTHFSGQLLDLIRNCTVYYDYTMFNTTSPFPYGMDRFGRFVYKQNATHVDWPYQCRGWVDPKTINSSDIHKTWDLLTHPFNHSLFFGGGLINLEMPGEEHLFPCGIRPNGSFTGAYLNMSITEEYPYGQFPDNDFPYLSYFFNASFDYGAEYDRNKEKNVSLLVGSQNYYNSSLTPLLNCTALGYCVSGFHLTCNTTSEDYPEYGDYSGSGSGDYDDAKLEAIVNATLDWLSGNVNCSWKHVGQSQTFFSKQTTETLTTHTDGVVATYTTGYTTRISPLQTTYTDTDVSHSHPNNGLLVASQSESKPYQTLLILTGYWISQGICEAILLRTTSTRGKRRIKAFSLAITSSLILGNVVDLVTNLSYAIQHRTWSTGLVVRGGLCTYDFINLLSTTAQFLSPSIRGTIQRLTHKVCAREYMPMLEKTMSGSKHNLIRIDRTYRHHARAANLALNSIGLAVAGITAISTAITVLSTDSDRGGSAFYFTLTSLVVAAFSALFFRSYKN